MQSLVKAFKKDIDAMRIRLNKKEYRKFLLKKLKWWHADKHQNTPNLLHLVHQMSLLLTSKLEYTAVINEMEDETFS